MSVCCFIGHRKINSSSELETILKNAVESLINNGVDTFLFGSKSQFDNLCWKVVTDFISTNPKIKRVYIRSTYPYISDSYKEYLLENYEETKIPEKVINAGRSSYVERNYYMIDNSDYCVFYYDENYMPPERKQSRRDLFAYQPKSGTKVAYEYATKKGKNIVNVFPLI